MTGGFKLPVVVLAAVAIQAGGGSWAQSPPGEPVKPLVLHKVGGNVSPGQAPFGSWGSPVCDQEGNVYFQIDRSRRIGRNPIWKLNAKAEKKTEYELPPDLQKTAYMADFAVSPRGDAFALVQEKRKVLVLSFDSDGRPGSRTVLATPDFLEPDYFAVFLSGEIFLGGHFGEDAKDKKFRGRPYVAIFLPDGSLARRLSPDTGLPEAEAPFDYDRLPEGGVVAAMDGNVYNLRADRILVVSPAGEIVRTIPIGRPSHDHIAHRILLSGHVLVVQFTKTEKNHYTSHIFRAFDLSDGIVLNDYVPGEDLTNAVLCFSSGEGFTFSASDHGRVEFVRAWVK